MISLLDGINKLVSNSYPSSYASICLIIRNQLFGHLTSLGCGLISEFFA